MSDIPAWLNQGLATEFFNYIQAHLQILGNDALDCTHTLAIFHRMLFKGAPYIVHESYESIAWVQGLRYYYFYFIYLYIFSYLEKPKKNRMSWRGHWERLVGGRSKKRAGILDCFCGFLARKIRFHRHHPVFEGSYSLSTHIAQQKESNSEASVDPVPVQRFVSLFLISG